MKWLTIYVQNPKPELADLCIKNCAGQFILIDGEYPIREARNRARTSSFQCSEVQIFCGKRIGTLAERYRNGQSV